VDICFLRMASALTVGDIVFHVSDTASNV